MTVYFIKPIGFDGPIKIGNSCDPSARGEQLALWSPFPLEVVAALPGGIELEQRFHNKFREFHRGHEWFTATDTLKDDIEAIAAGIFDVSTLPASVSLAKGRPSKGDRTWTAERRATHARQVAMKRAERASGLRYGGMFTPERCAAFIENPCAATGGITPQAYAKRFERYHGRAAASRGAAV